MCPTAAGFNFTCSWDFDSFTSGQTFPTGTSQVDLYTNNNPAPLFHSANANNVAGGAACAMTEPSPLSDGDVLVSDESPRGELIKTTEADRAKR